MSPIGTSQELGVVMETVKAGVPPACFCQFQSGLGTGNTETRGLITVAFVINKLKYL